MKLDQWKELQTPRLNLRRLRLEDVLEYYERIASDGDVAKYLPLDPHQDLSESLAELEQTQELYESGGCWRWGVALKEDDSLIGVFELLPPAGAGEDWSFLCRIGEEWWSMGYAAEAGREILRFAREEMGVQKLTADHFALNAAAGGLMRSLGMVQTGTVPGKYEKHGQLHDAHTYELCAAQPEPLTANEYQRLAMTTLNPALTQKDVLLNGVMGLCGEAGEAIDIVKKHLHQGHELDRAKLSKELGDVAWYLAETAWALEIPLEEILRMNLEKLKNRYPQGFDTEKSIHR